MTYKEKLEELRKRSLSDQVEFLKVIEEIRKLANKGEPLDEALLFQRDKIYNQFNTVLKDHRRLINYIEANNIPMDDVYPEDLIVKGVF